MANKRKLVNLLAHRLFSTMLPFLLHARGSASSKPSAATRANVVVSPASSSSYSRPVQRDGCPPPSTTGTTLVVDVDTALLLRSTSSAVVDLYFPYFMLVALEAGGFLRGLVLLLFYPLLRLLALASSSSSSTCRAIMAAVAFCGLRAGRFRAGRAVLPKWFMEDVAAEAFEAAVRDRGGRRLVCVTTGMPRVMVDGFLGEYLGADEVVGREMRTLWGFYTGLMHEQQDELCSTVVVTDDKQEDSGGGDADADVVGFSGSSEFLDHPLARCCKEVYVASPEERRRCRALSRDKHPKPVVFHDGRLAFLPTAAATTAMFAWLPFGAALAAFRLAIALTIPYRYSTPILAATGMSWRLKGSLPPPPPPSSSGDHRRRRGQLFVCNHRTLIDPVYVSVALDRPVRAVSYSLSRLSELISPIGRTVRLARDRAADGRVMARLLAAGDLVVVCPEGTTCREPYLLRFSPLFAELSDDVVPVGIAVETSMFYATTAGGLKCLDPLYYMVNPRMCYTVQFLDRVDTAPAKEGKAPSVDVANRVQRRMGDALGYGCTMLTRKDKYLMLAGNDGIVRNTDDKKAALSVSVSAPAPAPASAAAGKKNKTPAQKND